ncbi:hypothetical protein BH23BAC4_BH23BAC4_00370 [soil metagenome]
MTFRISMLAVVAAATILSGCDFLGSKNDPTTNEIFREGAIDPTQFDDVGYVPLFPFFTQTMNGGFDAPNDVFVGYDEFIYVTDRRGVHLLDLAGRAQNFIGQAAGQPIRDAGCVMQDRRFDLYVCARRDTLIAGRNWDLPVVYRFRGITTGGPAQVADIIWHVFDDRSRQFNVTYRDPRVFEGGISDEDAEFTGVGVLEDNSVYITRRGRLNRRGSPPSGDGRPATVFPFNSILMFSREGVNTGRVEMGADDHSVPTLRSSVYPSAIITYFAPPQRTGLLPRLDFFVAQAPPPNAPVATPRFSVLAINAVITSDGLVYQQDAARVGVSADPSRGDGFLYEEFKFQNPTGLARAGDGTGYLFVVDSGKDSLFVFNDAGVEGVAPPPGAQDRTRPRVVSFGGTGAGPMEFNDPMGIAYLRRTLYVADRGNNRISRYRLNTDFE